MKRLTRVIQPPTGHTDFFDMQLVAPRRLGVVILVLVTATATGASRSEASAPASAQVVANEFVRAANRGDFRTVCSLYSRTYLKVSNAQCRRLYEWGVMLYGTFDYRIVAERRLASGRWHIALTRWHDRSFIVLRRERPGWRIVGGGW
jgi:hypothetical protein